MIKYISDIYIQKFMPGWWNGIHARLKIVCRKACGFDSHPGHQNFTFRFLTEELVGGALRRPLIWLSKSRNRKNCWFCSAISISRFEPTFIFFYPFFHYFESIILLSFKTFLSSFFIFFVIILTFQLILQIPFRRLEFCL